VKGLALGLVLLLIACAPKPDRVFVPGAPFKHAVHVTTSQGVSAKVRVGEWLTLHASRETGPWVEVARESLGPDGCWVAPPPPALEEEVSDNLRWMAQPAEPAVFNLDIRDDHTRQVRFAAAGRYTLKASSSTWCSPHVDSGNELSIDVEAAE